MAETQLRDRSSALFEQIQESICSSIEELEGGIEFRRDAWKKSSSDSSSGIQSGGGITCVLEGGGVFEKAGVNFSKVEGILPATMAKPMLGCEEEVPFFATGISLVLHPFSPLVPTTHANYRYIEAAGHAWFGGGADLTPYVLFEEDATHFHSVYRTICDRSDEAFYPRFKKQCDSYFFIPHRNETRGIGGIFFDYMGREDPSILAKMFLLVSELAPAFLESYLPIVRRRATEGWTPDQKHFQLLRRGRYVEFNLIYDRGTQFGLQTSGRIESILMSLPPEVRWDYDVQFPEDGPEQQLLQVLQNPREWA